MACCNLIPSHIWNDEFYCDPNGRYKAEMRLKKQIGHLDTMCLYFLHRYGKHLHKEREMRQRCSRLKGTKAKKYYARLQRFQDKFPLDLYSKYVDLRSDAVETYTKLYKGKCQSN